MIGPATKGIEWPAASKQSLLAPTAGSAAKGSFDSGQVGRWRLLNPMLQIRSSITPAVTMIFDLFISQDFERTQVGAEVVPLIGRTFATNKSETAIVLIARAPRARLESP